MKTKTKILTCVLLCATLSVSAQKTDSLRYGGMQQLSLSFTESGTGFGLTVVNGIRYKRFFTGIGVDYFGQQYYRRYLPQTTAIYLDTRYYMTRTKRFFVKLDGGVNLIVGNMYWDSDNMHKKRGYFWGTGVGFKARLGKELFYVFDISYAVRQTRYDISYQDWRIPSAWMTEKLNNIRPMIVVNLGLEVF